MLDVVSEPNKQHQRTKLLHPTRHKIGHFGEVVDGSSQPISWLVLKKLNLTQHKQTTQEENSLS